MFRSLSLTNPTTSAPTPSVLCTAHSSSDSVESFVHFSFPFVPALTISLIRVESWPRRSSDKPISPATSPESVPRQAVKSSRSSFSSPPTLPSAARMLKLIAVRSCSKASKASDTLAERSSAVYRLNRASLFSLCFRGRFVSR